MRLYRSSQAKLKRMCFDSDTGSSSYLVDSDGDILTITSTHSSDPTAATDLTQDNASIGKHQGINGTFGIGRVTQKPSCAETPWAPLDDPKENRQSRPAALSSLNNSGLSLGLGLGEEAGPLGGGGTGPTSSQIKTLPTPDDVLEAVRFR
jgi:hypothetical protein